MSTQDISSELEVRKQKIETLAAQGEIVYKERFARTHLLKAVTPESM